MRGRIFVLIVFFLWACDGGFQRFDPVVDDTVKFCLQEKIKQECRNVTRRPPGPTPRVIGSVPDNLAQAVDPATKQIDIIFSEPMKALSEPNAIEMYLVTTSFDGTDFKETLSPLSLEYSQLEWLDAYTVRLHLSWQQLPENAVLAFKPSTAFQSSLNVPVSEDEPLRRFSVTQYETFFPLLTTNQYDCYEYSGTTWNLAPCNNPAFQLYAEDTPLGQNGHYEDNTNAPPDRRLMVGPLQNPSHNFTVIDALGNSITIQPVITQDTATNLTWTSCSMPGKTLKRPPVFRTDGYYAAQPCTTDPGLYSWGEAMAVCGLLNQANNGNGYAAITNWRLPRFDELMTLIDYGYYNGKETAYPFFKGPAVLFDPYNTARNNSSVATNRYFPYKIAEGPYWTSTVVKRPAYGPSPEISFEVMVVDFATGNYRALTPLDTNNKAYVICVSGDNPHRLPRTFSVDTTNGVVSDSRHGLMWQRCLAGQSNPDCTGTPQPKKWTATDNTGALNYCETLSLAGYNDWRLPNLNELRTLYTKTFNGNLALDETAFPNSPGSNAHPTLTPNYLTSTTNVSFAESNSANTTTFPHVWTVNFGLGHFWLSIGVNMLSTRDKNQAATASGPFARCVRNLLP